jgi:hypothetical protein
MSLIYQNKKLLNDLIKSAQQSLPIPIPQPTNKPAVNSTTQAHLQITSKLIDSLTQQYVASVMQPDGADLTINDVSSLGNFLTFAANNNVKIDGQKVVYLGSNPPPDGSWKPLRDETTSSNFATQASVKFYVNKDLMSKYIAHLVENIPKDGGEGANFAKNALKSIIDQINQKLGTSISSDPQTPQQDISSLAVCSVNQVINDPKSQQVVLFGKDLKDDPSFVAWAKQISVFENGTAVPLNAKNICSVINAIYTKITSAVYDVNQKPLYDIAIQKLLEVSKLHSCSISVAPQGNTPGQQQGGQGDQRKDLDKLNTLLPLKDDVIDFNAINQFIETYIDFSNKYAGNLSGQVNEFKSRIDRAISLINSKIPGISVFDLEDGLPGAKRISSLLSLTTDYNPVVNSLRTIIEATINAINLLKNTSGKNTEIANTRQVGSGSSTGNNNLAIISNWEAQAPAMMSRK